MNRELTPAETVARAATLNELVQMTDVGNTEVRLEVEDYYLHVLRWYWLRQMGIDIVLAEEPAWAGHTLSEHINAITKRRPGSNYG